MWLKALFHYAMFRATLLRDKMHETLHSVTVPLERAEFWMRATDDTEAYIMQFDGLNVALLVTTRS